MNSTWPLRVAAQAADMKPSALMQWFYTGVLSLQGNDRKSTGSGDHAGLSKQRACQAAITQVLNRRRVSVSYAARGAFQFTDCGNTGRAAGELFPVGKTILLLNDLAIVKNVFSDTSFFDLSIGSASIIAVDLAAIVEQVDAVLNNHRKQY